MWLAHALITAQACTAAGITFPSPLIGMFAIIGTLLVLSKTAPDAADAVEDAFAPAVDWIARWLPLFYVPLLVTIPLSIQVRLFSHHTRNCLNHQVFEPSSV